MWKWLGSILGTEKALERTIGAVSKGIDKAFYTEEEKADAAEAKRKAVSQVLLDWLKATQGQNKARRVLALAFSFTWLAQYILSSVLDVAAIWLVDHSKQLTESAAAIDARADSMTGAIMLILGFYFAAPYMGDFASKAMERFGGTKKEKDPH